MFGPKRGKKVESRLSFRIWRVASGVLLVLALGWNAFASPRVAWQIGTFDNSASEFAPLRVSRANIPAGNVVYVVGESTPARNWPAFQPGSANGKAGCRVHPYTVQFHLSKILTGLYELRVGFTNIDLSQAGLQETRRLSILQVSLNGHVGWAYQYPKWHDVPGAKHWSDLIKIEIPTQFLKRGTNTLVLTAIDQPATCDDVGNPGFVYDALEMTRDPDRHFDKGMISARVLPTIFYKRSGNRLLESVDVLVTSNSSFRGERLTLRLDGQEYRRSILADHDFGEARLEFQVPEFAPGTKGEVIVARGRHSRRFPVLLSPAKKWNLFLVANEHLDIGFTDYQAKVAEVHSRVLDEVMNMIQRHPDFRYSPDGFWVIQRFFAGRNARDRARLLRLIQEKKIFVPAQYANLLTGFPTVETLIRSLYPSFRFDEKHGEDFDYANITDVPSYSWSYASVLAAAGLKYFIAASNNTRAPIFELGNLNEESPFWWEGPDGGKILMWYTKRYAQIGRIFGLTPDLAAGHDALPRFLRFFERREYKSDGVLVFGAQPENTDMHRQLASLAEKWNKVYAYPHLRFSGFAEALGYIAGQCGSSIPTVRGDGGPYWEDGIVADARFAAMERNTEQQALSAEKLSTISSILSPYGGVSQELVRRLWENMVLYDEHTFDASTSVRYPQGEESRQQSQMKRAFAKRAEWDCDYLLKRSMAGIASKITDGPGTLIVFNPLSWKRTGLVETDIRKGFEIVDVGTGQAVPFQVLLTHPPYQRVRFLARDVPSVGYKCYAIKPTKTPQPSSQTESGDVMENAYYRVLLDPQSGAVKSIFDKQLQEELVNRSSAYRFDQYLYVTGGDKPVRNRLIVSDRNLPLPKLTVHPAGGGRLISITRQPFGTVARLESSAVNTPRIESEIILFNRQKRIEFINHVDKKDVYAKEGVYFAFPFAMSHPEFRYGIQNGYVNPAHDQLPGAGKEWFSVQHWIEAQQGDFSVALVPIDAPLVSLGDIVRGTWPLTFGQRKGTIFSYIMNNYWFTNYRAGQGGNFTFRYMLTSDPTFQPAKLSQLGWSAMTPFEIDHIIPNDKAVNTPAPLNAVESSFVKVDSPDVVLVDWKRAEDRQGTIMRFLEVAGKDGTTDVQIPLMDVDQAWECNAMERDEKQLSVSSHGFSLAVHPFQIVTVRVKGTINL